MRNRKKNQKKLQLQVDPNDLIAKQSARTTFKLSEKTSNLLKVAAKTHEKRGLLMEELDRHKSQLIDLFNRNERMLHKDDAFWVRFKTLTEITHKQVEKIRKTFKDKSEFEY
ncbi:MAG: hypothetical protein KJO60_06275 [Desulfofustis sp.]|nr:hypothetical protein [Desulfofustis sp.]